MNRNDQDFIVQKIRTQYADKQSDKLDALKALDSKVKRPAIIFAYIFGVTGAIVMGSGMSLVMTDIGSIIGIEDSLVPGVIIGIIGVIMCLVTCPLYNTILKSRRRKYKSKVIELSEEIMKG